MREEKKNQKDFYPILTASKFLTNPMNTIRKWIFGWRNIQVTTFKHNNAPIWIMLNRKIVMKRWSLPYKQYVKHQNLLQTINRARLNWLQKSKIIRSLIDIWKLKEDGFFIKWWNLSTSNHLDTLFKTYLRY